MTGRQRLASWIEFWSSSEATIVFLGLALCAQLPHSAVVFHRVSTTTLETSWGYWGVGLDWVFAVVAAIAVEVAVLVFVLKGRLLLSWFFAAASCAMNLIFYWRPGWDIANPDINMLGALLWSALLPAAIAFYSHEVGGEKRSGVAWWQRVWAKLAHGRNDKQLPVSVPLETIVPKTKTPMDGVSGALGAFADVFVQSVDGYTGNGSDVNRKRTTKRNRDGVSKVDRVMQLWAEGLTDEQIADALEITPTTVRGYRKKARDRDKQIEVQ